jgi:membrane-bound metal-dependent hydrolase YbcI (DUF457 family)
MDPLSHVALAHNLVRLRQPSPAATGVIPAAVLGALSPDVDVFLLPRGWDRYMTVHESGTHSVLGALVCAALAAALARAVWRRGWYVAMLAAAITGALSHLWFDLSSGATIRLFWPLVETRVSNLGVFAMGDPWVAVWSIVTAIVIARRRERRVRTAVIFCAGLAIFVAVKTATRVEAARVFRTHVLELGEVLILPVWGSLTAWEVYGQDTTNVSQWLIDARTGSIERRMTAPVLGSSGADHPIVTQSLDWDTVRNFRRTHGFAFARTTTVGGTTRVMWSDLRYCQPAAGSGQQPVCAVGAGGEQVAPATAPRLIVTIGNVVQTR